MTARLWCKAIEAWRRLRSRHESPFDDDFLERLNVEVQASLRRARRSRASLRRQLRKAAGS